MKNPSKRRKYPYILGFIIVVILGVVLAFFSNTDFYALRDNPFKTSKLNILIIGYDSSINGPPRADTIILTSFDLETKSVGILSIPRDTRVEIPGHGINKINASHAFGGVELTDKTLESFLNVPIDYYVETDFKGFANIIDILGGVELNIERTLHYVDKAGGLYIHLPAGRQKLDGDKALQYVRFREDVYGDIGRVKRQQKFIKAMVKRILSPDVLVKLPSLYKEVKDAVNTNILVQDISPFLHLINDMKLDNFKTAIVPGEPKYINKASFWIADQEELKIVVNNLILSKEYIRNSQYRLAIYNGNGKVGLAKMVSEGMEKYGFRIAKISNADNYNYTETLIKYYDSKDKNIACCIQEVIGGKIIYEDKEENKSKKLIDIIIGSDYLI